ncbi:MAG TPA: ferritin-like domain-containing protein [Solirubrobacterales bacterium]|nr:ferritin-like domain-containing protein [Solirubrobacterales bacterium]
MRLTGQNRITLGGAKRRGLVALGTLVAVGALAGCGGGGTTGAAAGGSASSTEGGAQEVSTPTPAPSLSPDGEAMNKILARQEGAVAAFAKVIPHLSPRLAQMASYFRAQEQEHVDAVLKALRGLEDPAEPGPEEIEVGEMKTDEERLVFLYEVEGATIDEELSAISNLEAPWPRSLLASTVADQAQHLTLLRQALGAGPLASVPKPFENGTTPPPDTASAPAN